MKIKRLLEEKVAALRQENSTLRQAVPPEKQKYLPQKPEQTPKPPSIKDKLKLLLPKLGKILAVVVVLGAIAALIVVEITILMPKDSDEDIKNEDLPESIPYTSNISGLNAYFNSSITEYGDRLYFVSSANGQLYYCDVNGNIKRVDKAEAENLIAAGSSVYYINKSTSTLYKADVADSKTQSVGRALCTYALVAEDGIYCIAAEKGEIRRYNPNGLQYDVLAEGFEVTTFDVLGKDLCILSEGELFLLETEKENIRTLKSDVYLSGIVGGKLMASDGKELFILESEEITPTGIAARDFNGNESILVCQDPDKPTILYTHDNGGSKILAADYKGELAVTENYVSYLSVDGFKYLIDISTGQRTVLTNQ